MHQAFAGDDGCSVLLLWCAQERNYDTKKFKAQDERLQREGGVPWTSGVAADHEREGSQAPWNPPG